ncbi:MAG: hypothetical protein HY901_11170 [Deltaproteobacteria bacterium]|nr:hypothetical protein [Deltaproteobacteria bacterium]
MKSVTLALFVALAPGNALAAPEGLPERRVSLEFKDIPLAKLFDVLGGITKRTIVLHECVNKEETVTFKLKNVPPATIFDMLSTNLALSYTAEKKRILVGCRTADDPALAKRVSIDVRDVPADEALRLLATAAGLSGADVQAAAMPQLRLTLNQVTLGTALRVVAESTGLNLRVASGQILAVASTEGTAPAK